jgi:ABC-type polysaccharide/polyol phosphate transport system ATPase subunit
MSKSVATAIEVRSMSAELRAEHRPIRSLREWFVTKAVRRPAGAVLFDVLHSIEFEVGRGELVAVVGPNGAGKTSLLRVLAGIIPPRSGRVRVVGRIAPLIDLGAGFDPELTGDENIGLYGAILGLRRSELVELRDGILDFAGLREAADLPVKSYSSGMIARLGFSIATAVDPEVLLIDEVLAVGDEAFRARCFERIEELCARGTAVVLVSHDLPLVERWAKRALRLDGGRQVEFGDARSVTEAYRAEVAA